MQARISTSTISTNFGSHTNRESSLEWLRHPITYDRYLQTHSEAVVEYRSNLEIKTTTKDIPYLALMDGSTSQSGCCLCLGKGNLMKFRDLFQYCTRLLIVTKSPTLEIGCYYWYYYKMWHINGGSLAVLQKCSNYSKFQRGMGKTKFWSPTFQDSDQALTIIGFVLYWNGPHGQFDGPLWVMAID